MIVFAIYSVSQIRICEEFARRLPLGQRFFFLSFNERPGVNAQLRESAQALGAPLEVLQDRSEAIPDDALPQARRQYASHQPYQDLPDIQNYRNMLLKQVLACDSVLTDYDVNLVIVCEDGPGGCAPLIAAAKRRNVLVAEMPFGIGEMRDYDIYLENRASENTLNRVQNDDIGVALRTFAPHWIKQTPYGDVTLFLGDFVLARLATGMDLPEPWVVHGGDADVLLVESEAMERIYAREQVPHVKRIMTGSCYADVVYDKITETPELRRAWEMASLIDPGNPRILIALPPSYHQEYVGKSEFPTYQEAIGELLAGCRAAHPNARITVSIHPAIKADDRRIITELADEVSEDWLLRLIPQHDVFVSTFSSTIRWTIACGKPIVNYDLYQFQLLTYDTASSVFTTPVLQDALGRLRTILSSPEHYHEAALQVQAQSKEWGIMDGRNFERIWNVLQERKKTLGKPAWLRWLTPWAVAK